MSAQTKATKPALAEITVGAVMHRGVLTCPAETPLRTATRMLASYNVHCVVVLGSDREHEEAETEPWLVLSDLDVVAAALSDDDDRTAGGSASTPIVWAREDESLEQAARAMVEHGTTHLVVVDREGRRPVGVLSTLDVAAALAGRRVRSGPPRIAAGPH